MDTFQIVTGWWGHEPGQAPWPCALSRPLQVFKIII